MNTKEAIEIVEIAKNESDSPSELYEAINTLITAAQESERLREALEKIKKLTEERLIVLEKTINDIAQSALGGKNG
jgi:hypothetical protein